MAATYTYPDPNARWARDERGLSMRTQFKYTGPASYLAGGDAILPGQIKLGTIEYMPMAIARSLTNAVVLWYNPSTAKIMAFWCAGAGAALVEVTDATDLSLYTATMVAEGRG